MVLAYCVAKVGERKLPGALQSLRENNIECFFEQRETPITELQQEAVEYFRKNQELFGQTDILEFRFPTLLKSLAGLETFLRAHAEQIASELDRLQGLAQVAVYPTETPSGIPKSGSGTEYLRAKSDIEKVRLDRLRELTARGDGSVRDALDQHDRILLLLPRKDATSYMSRIKADPRYRVAGPFPPSAFAKLLS